MPATFIVLPAVLIGVIAWLAAWWFTRKPRLSPREELRRLRNHAAWLEQRLDLARQERWDCEMIVGLSDQLGTACQELADAQRGAQRITASTTR
jgi:hypothetical protein